MLCNEAYLHGVVYIPTATLMAELPGATAKEKKIELAQRKWFKAFQEFLRKPEKKATWDLPLMDLNTLWGLAALVRPHSAVGCVRQGREGMDMALRRCGLRAVTISLRTKQPHLVSFSFYVLTELPPHWSAAYRRQLNEIGIYFVCS